MTESSGVIGPNTVFAVVVLFCRIGSCIMLAPGLSGSQAPMQIRILIAVAITLVMAPVLLAQPGLQSLGDEPLAMMRVIVMEAMVGGMIGFLGRLFFSALEALAVACANFLALTNPFGVEVDSNQIMPPLATLVVMGATTLIFVSDFHWEVLRGVAASYVAIPIRREFDPAFSLREIGAVLGQSFLAAVRVTSPFFLYAVVANFALALVNRVTPQIAIFFVGPPFIVAGGLMLLYFAIRSMLGQFMGDYAHWLSLG